MSIRRIVAVFSAALVLVAGVGVQPAAAQGHPVIIKSPKFSDSMVLGNSCEGFAVRVDTAGTQGVQVIFEDSLLVAGSLKATATRLLPDGSDGPSVSFNFSGPGRIDVVNGVIHAWGPWLFLLPDDPDTPEWEGVILLTNGNTLFDINTVSIVSTTTQVRDICDEVA